MTLSEIDMGFLGKVTFAKKNPTTRLVTLKAVDWGVIYHNR